MNKIDYTCDKLKSLVLSANSARIVGANTLVHLKDTVDERLASYSLRGATRLSDNVSVSSPPTILSVESPVNIHTVGRNLLPNAPDSALVVTSNGLAIMGEGLTSVVVRVFPSSEYRLRGDFSKLAGYSVQYATFRGRPHEGSIAESVGTVKDGGFIYTTSVVNYVMLTFGEVSLRDMKAQLSYGSTAHEYTAPKSETISIPIVDAEGRTHALEGLRIGTNGLYSQVYDTVTKSNIDGRWYVVKNTKLITFSAEASESWEATSRRGDYRIYLPDARITPTKSDYCISDRFTYSDAAAIPMHACTLREGYFTVRLSELQDGVSDIVTYLEWLSQNPITLVYPLGEPISYELRSEPAALLDRVSLYYPVTTLATEQANGVSAILDVNTFVLGAHDQQPCLLTDREGELNMPVTRADLVYFADGTTLADRF